MTTPDNIKITSLNDQWGMNFSLCDDSEPMLKLHNVPWILRKVLTRVSITTAIRTYTETPGGVTQFVIQYKPPLGLPSSEERRTFDFEGEKFTVPFYGTLKVRMRWATSADLDEISKGLAEGFEDESNIYMRTDHYDTDTVTHQVLGFEKIEGTRYHTRHIVVQRGELTEKLRLVYDYIGPKKN